MRATSLLLVLAAASPALAAPGYEQPPQPLLDALHAPGIPVPMISPTRERLLLVSWVEFPRIARVARPFLRLAGVRVEPRNRSRHDTPAGYGIPPCARAVALVTVAGGAETPVDLGAAVCARDFGWSSDGKRFYFQNVADDSVELWLGDGLTGQVRRVPGVRLNPMLDGPVQWLPDDRSLLVKLVPEDQGPPPPAPEVPPGPDVSESGTGTGESSTYENRDALQSVHDEELFTYYAAAQLAVVDAATGAVKRVGKPDLLGDVTAAPDGRHVLVETLHGPYSHVVTCDRFPREVAVWDLGGGAPRAIASLPLQDRVPIRGVPVGRRGFDWRPNEPATLYWAEALDGGDWNVEAPARDKVMMQRAPFTAQPVEIARTQHRFAGLMFSTAPRTAFLTEYDANRSWRRTWLVDVDDRRRKPRLLWDLSLNERYKHPGWPVTRRLPGGWQVVRQEGNAIFLSGTGSSPTGDRPFLDRFDVTTGKTVRLWRSAPDALETFFAFSSERPREARILTWHQSPSDPPNLWQRALGAPVKEPAAGEPTLASTATPVTHIPDPMPMARGVKRRLVTYKRADGVDLSFTLITPPGYVEGTRLPAILNAYPLDYAEAATAGQVTGSQQVFTNLRGYQLLALAGYAIIDRASFPIVGDPKRAYDTYIDQLVADARAAVDKAVELGVVDRDRIGVTGHSHGALMTANLLARSDLFRAGVATSGAYNYSLSPFGFQNERRSVWDAREVYIQASPFFFADKIAAPLLLVHGEDDANPGTPPIHSKTLFEALRGRGKVTRLVMLPHEPHWYAALESNEQLLAEMARWFDRYVKEAKPRPER